MSDERVLIVIPTLGTRPELLNKCVDSIAQQSVPAAVVIATPEGNGVAAAAAERCGGQVVTDPGSLTKAINAGVGLANSSHDYVNWIGDDDLLEAGSLATTVAALDRNPDAVLAYGACRYIDEDGHELWVSKAGSWAPRILKWGPDLIPQPGMLVRMSAWRAVGGLDESFRFAFDLDLLLKIQPLGRFIDVGQVVSAFRWHGDSLTVGDRTASLQESERARRKALSPVARRVAWMWERPVRGATRLAARELNRRATRIRGQRA